MGRTVLQLTHGSRPVRTPSYVAPSVAPVEPGNHCRYACELPCAEPNGSELAESPVREPVLCREHGALDASEAGTSLRARRRRADALVLVSVWEREAEPSALRTQPRTEASGRSVQRPGCRQQYLRLGLAQRRAHFHASGVDRLGDGCFGGRIQTAALT